MVPNSIARCLRFHRVACPARCIHTPHSTRQNIQPTRHAPAVWFGGIYLSTRHTAGVAPAPDIDHSPPTAPNHQLAEYHHKQTFEFSIHRRCQAKRCVCEFHSLLLWSRRPASAATESVFNRGSTATDAKTKKTQHFAYNLTPSIASQFGIFGSHSSWKNARVPNSRTR